MLSIIIPTHNGENVLPITLDAMSFLYKPNINVELIIVSNACTDKTHAVVESFRQKIPFPLNHISTEIPGRANALNLGIANSYGEIIIMTDDDVIPSVNWLQAYYEAQRNHLDVDIFGGQIRHHWQKAPPTWLKRLAAEGWSYGGTPQDLRSGPAKPGQVKGANIAIRRELFQNFHFDNALGYKAGAPMLAGEETDLVNRAVQAGHKIWFVPDALIYHIVRPQEVAVYPILRRYFRIGRGSQRVKGSYFHASTPTIWGYPRHMFRSQARNILMIFTLYLVGRKYDAVHRAIQAALLAGRAYQWRIENRHRG